MRRRGAVRSISAQRVAAVAMAIGFVVADAGPALAAVPEPPWPARCPLKVGLLLDRSGSMGDSFESVRSAASDMVDALREQPSEVMVVAFGTQAKVVLPLSDVSDDDRRHEVKNAIKDLGVYDLNDGNGGTNWQDALSVARDHELQVVVIMTDGYPTTYGSPAVDVEREDPAPLAQAAAVADQLKQQGTRVAPVGIGLGKGGAERLSAISGDIEGDDYFVTDLSALRRQLYDIAAKSCGVPLTALPQPEPAGFPVARVIGGAVVALATLLGAVFLVSRRRNGLVATVPRSATPNPQRVGRAAPIRLEDVSGIRATPPPPDPQPPLRSPHRGGPMSLDFLSKKAGVTPPDSRDDG